MPTISHRGLDMPASPIRRLVPYAEKAVEKGVKVIHLNIGQPDIKTPKVAMDAIRNIDLEIVEYSHSAGNESYRKKVAEKFRGLGMKVDYQDFLITTGGSEAIIFSFLSCLNPGEEIIIPEPFYANYNGFAAMAGINVVPIPSSIEDGFALPPIEEFEKAMTPNTKGILICNPNNPTGYLYSMDEMLQLRDLVAKHDLYLFSDEVYREFCYDGEKHISAMHLEGIENNVVMVDSVSKRYSECGVRIGALVTKNKDVINTALKYGQARLSPPGLGQIVGEASLETPPEYFDNVYNEYIARRNFIVDGLNKIPGVYSPMPKGAFYTVAKLPVDDADLFCQWILSDFEYKNHTVMMAPASGFYCTPGKGKDEVRIAYVLKVEDLALALEVLEKALKAYPGRTL
ncbi:pyridoxal phosphate-dependent aminotransferase [Carboxylicivirga linearis]|uniref:Pyridoxal phosphate-dependent aminotransferase n=1 Tax=Carboxylicivirga linearis TaxID=1628157 RepID=A0ABS5K1Q1_9BACT|nr:pyridoxal phosphate-dependent aminotransferase [Carboxylicivirga linearis]MBS2101077.1 pyridoxal phosphate-dependent aminotransferase [Carboxylicivirga linearis]